MLQLAHILWTILLLVIFVAIAGWAWSKPRQERFRQAASIPMHDDMRTALPESPAARGLGDPRFILVEEGGDGRLH